MKKSGLVCLVFFLTVNLFSHPHMWFTSKVEFVFSGRNLQGAFVTWTFDRFFSSDIIQGYDMNGDGKFNYAETTDVFNNAFQYTENYYYFIFIRQGDNRTSPETIPRANFSAWQNDGILSYRFYVDLSGLSGNEVFFACYDYTFFCDITYLPENPVVFSCDRSTVNPKFEIVENKDYPVYYNPVGAIGDNRVYFKWAEGLNTYYPKEIRVRF